MAPARRSRPDLGRRGVPLLILGIVILVPTLVLPGRWGMAQTQVLKPLLIEAVAIGLLLLMMSRASGATASVRRVLRPRPDVAVLLFAAGGSPTPFRSFS